MAAAPGDLLFKLMPPDPQSGAGFGEVLAVVDGNVVVGEPTRFHSMRRDIGRAYLFEGQTGALKFAFNNPTPRDEDEFGGAITGGDGRVFVSTLGLEDRVYSYSVTTGQLLDTILDPDGGNESFGGALAHGNGQLLVSNPSYSVRDVATIAVGRAYVFDSTNGNLARTIANPEPKRGDLFGFGPSLAASRNKVVVGAILDDLRDDNAPDGDNPGRVWVFNRHSGEVAYTLENPNPEARFDDSFGFSVAANDDSIVVGARLDASSGIDNSGTVYVFDSNTGALRHTLFSPQVEKDGEFGRSIALTPDGDILVGAWGTSVNGIDFAGHAYLFDGVSGNLLLDIPNPEPEGGVFGWSVATLRGGLVVGSPAAGAVYVFEAIPEPDSLALTVSLFISGIAIVLVRRKLHSKIRST